VRALEASKTPHVTLAKSVGGYPCAYVWYFDSTLSKGGFVRLHDIIIDYSNQALAQDVYDVAIYGLVNYAQPYKLSGSRTSPILDLSHVGTASGSSIAWTATTPAGTSVTVETNLSLDGGQTWQGWQQVTNGGPIPGISAGTDLSNARLQTRVTLQTTDSTVTPRVHSLTVEVGHQAVAVAAESLSQSSPLTFTAVGNRVRLVPSAGVTKWQLEHKPFATSFVDGTRPHGIVKLTNPPLPLDNFVINLWFKATRYPSQTNQWWHLFNVSYNASAFQGLELCAPPSAQVGIPANMLNLTVRNSDTIFTRYNLGFDLSAEIGKWHMVTLISNGSIVDVYIDGEKRVSATNGIQRSAIEFIVFGRWFGNVSGTVQENGFLMSNVLFASYDPATWTDEYIKFLYETQKPFFV
jgi:hypothetical protein